MPGHPPEHWENLAHGVRSRALGIKDQAMRGELEAIAQAYEKMARYAAKRESRSNPVRVLLSTVNK
jgi:hypothetical protein